MDRVETRELAYFLAVAEELHFGRAAGRLGIAQPPLSRAVQRLERRLGVRLLDRTARGVSLTPAGTTLAREAAVVLTAATAAVHRTRRAARAEPHLVVALKPGGDGGLLPAILDAYAREAGAVRVDVELCGVADRARLVREGAADVAFLHSPYEDLAGFDTEPLREEATVAVLPRAHRLAARADVSFADLDGEPLARWRGMAPAGDGPEVRDGAQLMQLIALGRAVAVAPESVRGQLRADLVCVPVRDAAPTTVVLAWPEGERSGVLAGFVRVATVVASAGV